MSLRKFVGIATILLALAALSATPSLAAKGGNGKAPKSGSAPSSMSLTVSPNPVDAGVNTGITFSGSGFGSNEQVWVTIGGVACCGGTTADSSGSFTYTTWIALDPGAHTASVLVREGGNWVWALNSAFSAQ